MSRLAIAFVHHANQLVITDGYADREGLSQIGDGYQAVLDLHRRFDVPAALHLSGTLVEALAWHRPTFLEHVRDGVRDHAVTLLGGTYSEPILTEIEPHAVRRQVAAMADLLRWHLDVPDGALPTAWLPERVWHPHLATALTDPALPGGGFRRVLLDDRLLAPVEAADTDPLFDRTTVDARGPFDWTSTPPRSARDVADPRLLVPRAVDAPDGRLVVVPISAHLRYLLPPRGPEHLRFLEDLLDDLLRTAHDPDQVLLVFADDMERCAGVGGWEPDGGRFAEAMRWVAESPVLRPVHLDDWLDEHAAPSGPCPEAGSYHELEVGWAARPDFRGWSEAADWRPYRELLATLEGEVTAARSQSSHSSPASHDEQPLRLAERLVMLGQHETAWRDRVGDELGGELAAWVRAGASHARLARPVLEVARWSAGAPPSRPATELRDIDGDGDEELVLTGSEIHAVVSPRRGARLTLLSHRDRRDPSGHASVIAGNPCDHWNLLEGLHQFMETPPGHPGALTDPDAPDLEWRAEIDPEAAVACLRPLVGDGLRRYAVLDGVPALAACVRLDAPGSIENAVIPDYLGTLLAGSPELRQTGGRSWSGWRFRDKWCWVGFDPEQADLVTPRWFAAGHSCAVSVHAHHGHADLLVGAGDVSDVLVARWLAAAREALHRPSPVPSVGSTVASGAEALR